MYYSKRFIHFSVYYCIFCVCQPLQVVNKIVAFFLILALNSNPSSITNLDLKLTSHVSIKKHFFNWFSQYLSPSLTFFNFLSKGIYKLYVFKFCRPFVNVVRLFYHFSLLLVLYTLFLFYRNFCRQPNLPGGRRSTYIYFSYNLVTHPYFMKFVDFS